MGEFWGLADMFLAQILFFPFTRPVTFCKRLNSLDPLLIELLVVRIKHEMWNVLSAVTSI